ncbi:hypothetical protein [Thalassomonas haliotis]|uniref:Uncharacterized protein n=1 Tax=Thalassomonas haliotis TaxID=485448 RepID=A0ABY7VFV3_9GAMM|nr:hypothetical protein [Thalassomonas haliotis]WDE12604.1 hypothetical protein H3N35_03755 [Thalassomonas haliotis]
MSGEDFLILFSFFFFLAETEKPLLVSSGFSVKLLSWPISRRAWFERRGLSYSFFFFLAETKKPLLVSSGFSVKLLSWPVSRRAWFERKGLSFSFFLFFFLFSFFLQKQKSHYSSVVAFL